MRKLSVMCRSLRFLLLAGFMLLAACKEAPLPSGVVALVDGRPVHLRTLQTLQDTRTAGLGAFEKPSLNSLRQKYGNALSALILQTLVLNEMERLGQPVPDGAVHEAEMRIRADYPDEEFEKLLRESSIDLDAWREIMRYRIGIALFRTQVLQPSISITLPEVEAYYEAHKEDFALARTLTLYQVSGEDKAMVEKARSLAEVPEEGTGLQVFRVHLRKDALPEEWKKAVNALKSGGASPVVKNANGFEYVVLVADTPERRLNIVEAYPHIEQILQEEKMDVAFDAWLEKKLATAKVLVSVHLAEELRSAAEISPVEAPASAPHPVQNQPTGAGSNTTNAAPASAPAP